MSTSRGTKRPRPPADFYVEFPKAVSGLKKHQESFMKGVDTCRLLVDSQLEENILKIDHQNKQLLLLDEQYEKKEKQHAEDFERKRKARRIDLDQELKAYGYEKATSIVTSRNEVAIDKDKLQELYDNLHKAQSDHKAEVELAIKKEKEKAHRQLGHIQQTTKLQQEAAVAKVQAQLEQKNEQIKVLGQTIQGLKEELVAARELVGRVADSQRAPAVHHHGPAR
jgi:hypothetical protein